MKRLKGLYRDCDPIDQPRETYRDALNININKEVGSVVTEEGTTLESAIPSSPIGSTPLSDGRVVLFFEEGIGVLSEEGDSTSLLDADLGTIGLSREFPIKATSRITDEGESVVYWTDGNSPPRFYNIDRDAGFTNASELNVFSSVESPVNINIQEVLDFGGSLITGSYQFSARYLDEEGNSTNFMVITKPIDVVREVQKDGSSGFFSQGNPTLPSGKSISMLLENLDSLYDRVQLAVIRYEDAGIADVSLLEPISIGAGDDIPFIYNGSESKTDGSIEEILIDNAHYDTAKSLTQVDSTLYMGNLKRDSSINYQKYANNIKAKLVSKTLDSHSKYQWAFGDETLTFFNKSFRREEVYAFYISFMLKNGQETRAFHIPGRESEGTELNTSTALEDLDASAKEFQLIPKQGTNGFGYWENETEQYPDNDNWDIVSIDSSGNETVTGTLRGEKVRHHRIPGYEDLPVTLGTDASGENSNISVLGVQFEDLVIPDDIREKITGIRLYHARKGDDNKLVLDQGWACQVFTDSEDLLENKIQRNSAITPSPDTLSIVPFSTLLRDRSLASVSYMKTNAVTLASKVERFDGPDYRKWAFHVMDQEPVAYSHSNYIKPIKAIASLPADVDVVNLTNLGFSNNATNTEQESKVMIELEEALSIVRWRAVHDEVDYEHGLMVSLMQLKKELFAPFDLQDLVPLGSPIYDVENFSPSASGFAGVQAEGNVTIAQGGPDSGNATSASATTTITGAPNDDGTISITYEGVTVNASILATDSIDDVGNKMSVAINASGSIGITSGYTSSTNTLSFTAKTAGTSENNNAVSIGAGSTGVTFTNSGPLLSGGEDPDSGSAGTFGVTIEPTGKDPFTTNINILYDDTPLDIANRLKDAMNNFSLLPYSATVDTSGSDPAVIIIADDPGEEWNATVTISTNTLDIDNFTSNITGGVDPVLVRSTAEIYGGDTFINKYGYRIGGKQPNGVMGVQAMYCVVESTDNIAFRQAGSDFNEVNGNNYSQVLDLLELEEQTIAEEGVFYDNYFAYDYAHSVGGHLAVKSTPFPKELKEITKFPNRVIRSQTDSNVGFTDRFRVFLEEDFLDLPKNRGEITNLDVLNNILLVHSKRGLFRTRGREELTTDDFRAFLGSGDIFSVKPDEMFSIEEGFAGLQNPKSATSTPAGYFFVDQQAGKVFLMAQQAQEISDLGMRNFFEDSLKWSINKLDSEASDKIYQVGLSATYDPKYKRIIFTKRDWNPTQTMLSASYTIENGQVLISGTPISLDNETYFEDVGFTISYLPEIQKWVSFHSYIPEYLFNNVRDFFSVKENNVYSHRGNPSSYYGDQYSMMFQFVDNEEPNQTKLVRNVEFITYAYDQNSPDRVNYQKTFDSLRIKNELQDTGLVDLIYFTSANGNLRNSGHTWKANKFRDIINPDTGEVDASLPFHRKKKLTGKYAIVSLYYTPEAARFLRLIDAKVTFRKHSR